MKRLTTQSSIKKMIRNYRPKLCVLAMTFIFLLLLPVVNCTTDQMKTTSMKPATFKNHLYDILKQEKFNNNYDEEEEGDNTKYVLENILKSFPHRRASAFHAMRGKRFIKTA